MTELRTELLFEMTATLNMDHWHAIGDIRRGERLIVEVTGGTFAGAHLRGEVLPFGADFAVCRTDGVTELDVRVILRTDDGAEIYAFYPGLNHQESLGPLGELPEGERYFRTMPRFETGAEQYQWLTRIVSIGVQQPSERGAVAYRVYAVL